ncbi:MAG: ComEC/Rec2 family competence protein [Planctomycetota bacterium]
MRVLFVDVGQGTCQIILLGGRRAMIIDAGASADLPLRTLRLFRIETIELLVVSHSHADHSGGFAKQHRFKEDAVTGIVADYRNSIKRIGYVYDSQFRHRPLAQYLVKLLRDKTLRKEQLLMIEASERPHELWVSEDRKTQLAAISPLGGDHLLAMDADSPNASSVVLELRHQGDRVVFAADSECDQWRDIYRLRNDRIMECKAVTMPHHGGLMQASDEDLMWFHDHAVDADFIVVSVGTINPHAHPRGEVIRAATASGSHVMCTQITEQCCSNLESLRPGVIGPSRYPCKSSSRPDFTGRAGRSRNVACAGTVTALLTPKGVLMECVDQHRVAVDALVVAGHAPLCRSAKRRGTAVPQRRRR